jgi:hypothetical protein
MLRECSCGEKFRARRGRVDRSSKLLEQTCADGRGKKRKALNTSLMFVYVCRLVACLLSRAFTFSGRARRTCEWQQLQLCFNKTLLRLGSARSEPHKRGKEVSIIHTLEPSKYGCEGTENTSTVWIKNAFNYVRLALADSELEVEEEEAPISNRQASRNSTFHKFTKLLRSTTRVAPLASRTYNLEYIY